MRQEGIRLENRSQLVMSLNLGTRVFMNCAGFIRIDTRAMQASAETEMGIDELDSTRIHPEHYDWARQIVKDATQDDESGAEARPPLEFSDAIALCRKNRKLLDNLLLDEFAKELERLVLHICISAYIICILECLLYHMRIYLTITTVPLLSHEVRVIYMPNRATG